MDFRLVFAYSFRVGFYCSPFSAPLSKLPSNCHTGRGVSFVAIVVVLAVCGRSLSAAKIGIERPVFYHHYQKLKKKRRYGRLNMSNRAVLDVPKRGMRSYVERCSINTSVLNLFSLRLSRLKPVREVLWHASFPVLILIIGIHYCALFRHRVTLATNFPLNLSVSIACAGVTPKK